MTEFPPKSEFRKWLRSLPPDEVVAKRWTCESCPLAMWLLTAKHCEVPHVRPNERAWQSAWRPTWPAPTAPLPDWANEFGLKIDRRGLRAGANNPFGPVTAADCLAVLRRTPRA